MRSSDNFTLNQGFLIAEKVSTNSVVVSDLTANTVVYFSIYGTNLSGTCLSDIKYTNLHVVPPKYLNNLPSISNDNDMNNMNDNNDMKYRNMMMMMNMKKKRCDIPKIY